MFPDHVAQVHLHCLFPAVLLYEQYNSPRPLDGSPASRERDLILEGQLIPVPALVGCGRDATRHWLESDGASTKEAKKIKGKCSKCEQHKAYKSQLGPIGCVGERIGKGELPDSDSADVQHLRYA